MHDRFDTAWLPDDLQSIEDAYSDPRVREMQQAAIEIAAYAYGNDLSDDELAFLFMAYVDKYAGLMKREVCVDGEYRHHRPDSVENHDGNTESIVGYYDGLVCEQFVSDDHVPSEELRHRIALSQNGNDEVYITTPLSTPLYFPTVMSPEKARALLERIQPLVDVADEAIVGSPDIETMIAQLNEIDFEVDIPERMRAVTYDLLALNMDKTARFLLEKAYDAQLSGSMYNQGSDDRIRVYGDFTIVKPKFAFCPDKEGATVPALKADVVNHNVLVPGQRVAGGIVPLRSIRAIESFTPFGFVDKASS